jgi:tetratricopeptide (TPR) repeat protein
MDGSLSILERKAPPEPAPDAANYLERGCELHDAGRLAEAEEVYREGVDKCGEDAVLLYNLGVLLQDLERKSDALAIYERALGADPGFADCHYNIALLYEALGKPRDAIRHMAQYRRLQKKP